MNRLWLSIGAILLAISASGYFGFQHGVARTEARIEEARANTQSALDEVGEKLELKRKQLLEREETLTRRAQEIEDEIIKLHGSSRAPDAASVQRLNQRWGDPGEIGGGS